MEPFKVESAKILGPSSLLVIEILMFHKSLEVLQTHINFPRFLPIFPDFLEQLSHLAPIY
jgi:hypothetical protein